jgi:hypothetical protein
MIPVGNTTLLVDDKSVKLLKERGLATEKPMFPQKHCSTMKAGDESC